MEAVTLGRELELELYTTQEAVRYLRSEGLDEGTDSIIKLVHSSIIKAETNRQGFFRIYKSELDLYIQTVREHPKPKGENTPKYMLASQMRIPLEDLDRILTAMIRKNDIEEYVLGGRDREIVRGHYVFEIYRRLIREEMAQKRQELV